MAIGRVRRREHPDLGSHPVAMVLLQKKRGHGHFRTGSLPVKKAPLGRILRNFRLHMRITYFRTGHMTDVTSGHAQWSDPPHDPPQMRLCPCPYTTNT